MKLSKNEDCYYMVTADKSEQVSHVAHCKNIIKTWDISPVARQAVNKLNVFCCSSGVFFSFSPWKTWVTFYRETQLLRSCYLA